MFEWKDEYSCNIAEIDNQHKNLLKIGSRLYEIVRNNGEFDHYDDIIRILYEMEAYTVYHFSYEEELLQENGYEELEPHKKQHQVFVNKLKEITKKDIDSAQVVISLDLVTFIADWIEHHILGSDHKYKDFLNSKGIF